MQPESFQLREGPHVNVLQEIRNVGLQVKVPYRGPGGQKVALDVWRL